MNIEYSMDSKKWPNVHLLMGITKNGSSLRFGGNIKSNMSWCLGRPDQPTCNVGEIQIFVRQKDKFQANYSWTDVLVHE